jgi:hypothetical protein
MLMTILQFDGWFSDGFGFSEVTPYQGFDRRDIALVLRVKNGPDCPETPLPLCPNQLSSSCRPGWGQLAADT